MLMMPISAEINTIGHRGYQRRQLIRLSLFVICRQDNWSLRQNDLKKPEGFLTVQAAFGQRESEALDFDNNVKLENITNTGLLRFCLSRSG